VSITQRIVVPAGEGRAARVRAGESSRVVDISGGQVGDLFAFVDGATSEYMSAEHTRPSIRRLFPIAGDVILSNHRRDMIRLEEDHSPGFHDTLYAACDPARYTLRGVSGPHRSCTANLVEAVGLLGEDVIAVPQPFNLFMHVPVDGDGSLRVVPASSEAGDYVAFVALMDIIVALSSCPMDVVTISTGPLTALAIEIA